MQTPAPPTSPLVLLDFDGTLTLRDVDFQIAEALLPPGRRSAYEPIAAAYESLEIGLQEYFRRLLALVGRPASEWARAAEGLPLRAGAVELVRRCRAAGLRVRVVSEGLDAYIVPILEAHGLGDLELACNRLVAHATGATVLPAAGGRPCARCLSCKGHVVQRAQGEGAAVAVVGDGASDLCAARGADRVYARGGLVRHCADQGIPCLPWTELSGVAADVIRWGQGVMAARAPGAGGGAG